MNKNYFIFPAGLLARLLTQTFSAWLGGQRQNSSSGTSPFYWKPFPGVEETISFIFWIPLSPNNFYGLESCMAMSMLTYTWDDYKCNTLMPAVCQADYFV